MLKQRVLSALVMLLVFMSTLFFLPWQGFIAFVTLIFLVAAWEWSSLSGFTSLLSKSFYTLSVLVLGASLAQLTSFGTNHEVLREVLYIACIWWLVGLVWVNTYPAGEKVIQFRLTRMLLGYFVLIPSWLSVSYLIQKEDGVLSIVLCLLLVTAADSGAYFSGRKFGRRKLAPLVSPGKSWEGVWGGLLLSVFIGAVFVFSFSNIRFIQLLLIILPAALISVVGDLIESMVKRVSGHKDSGTILPGHGGVLDRIDGLTSAIPVFSMSLLYTGWSF